MRRQILFGKVGGIIGREDSAVCSVQRSSRLSRGAGFLKQHVVSRHDTISRQKRYDTVRHVNTYYIICIACRVVIFSVFNFYHCRHSTVPMSKEGDRHNTARNTYRHSMGIRVGTCKHVWRLRRKVGG